MRIGRIRMQNFKCFEDLTLELHPQFTLLVGDNGAGKTTVLDALAVAAGIWLAKPPDSALVNSGRSIRPREIRLALTHEGDRSQFLELKPVSITAEGEISGQQVRWQRQIRQAGSRTTNTDASEAQKIIDEHYSRARAGEPILSPVTAYYGAGRAWLPSRDRRSRSTKANGPARRWEAFYDCFEERIRLTDLQLWFEREAIAFAEHRGRWRLGYQAIKRAILGCLPGADDLWFDGDRREIVLSINSEAQPFSNLSAGQRMMVALIGDIAIKAVSQNAHLVTADHLDEGDGALPEVLLRTPGLVLIDEIDVHLHPKWQRQVVRNLKETFPGIQFVGTSHSPFIIQSLEPGELRTLDPSGPPLVEYANRSVEDIAEEIQNVPVPQQSLKAQEIAAATDRYVTALRGTSGEEETEELKEARGAYRVAAKRYSANPGLDAILELETLAKKAKKGRGSETH